MTTQREHANGFLHRLGWAGLLLAVGGGAGCNGDGAVEVTEAPADVTLSAGDGTVTVAWTPVDAADSYTLYWDDQADLAPETATVVPDITASEYTVTGLQNGDPYWFAVSAVYPLRESGWSDVRAITLPPSAVSSLTCTAGDGVVTVDWDSVHGATSYNVYRGTQPAFDLADAVEFEGVVAPYDDASVVNELTYYYAVEAVGDGGASPMSPVLGATPRLRVGAPEQVAVQLVEESPNTLQITWLPPSIGTPDAYVLYWDTVSPVTLASNAIVGVVSPYVHAGLSGNTTYYYVVTAVQDGVESDLSSEVSGTPHGSPGGGETEGLGNNLSFPLVFANSYGLGGLPLQGVVPAWQDYNAGLRPSEDEAVTELPHLDPATVKLLNGKTYYPQQSASTWQAGWRDGSQVTQEVVLDWGDNLSSVPNLSISSAIRVEVALYVDDASDPLDAYSMTMLSGSGPSEMQGTSGEVVPSSLRSVHALNGRMTIEKLLGQGGQVDVSVPGFDSAVYESLESDGPGGFSTEVNVSGKLVYGMVWRIKDSDLTEAQKLGWWRLTFSLDPQAVVDSVQIPNNVEIVALDASETKASLDPSGLSSSIEVHLKN